MSAQSPSPSPQYCRFTPHMAWLLAAPHTWPASILPVLVASAAAAVKSGVLSVTLTCALLVICVLMQAAVNTFNDYFDYVKGTDSAEDNVDPSDAVLVYNNVNPASALRLAVGFLVVAFLLGIYAIYVAGWIPLAIACVGALVVVLYSGGKTPISYLPIGEAVSGLVMGGFIPLACYQVLTRELEWLALVWAIPTVIGVGLIMFTNNTCDIEKDVDACRNTLSVKLGRERARKAYHALMYAWVAAIVAIVALWFTNGLVVVLFMLLAAYPLMNALRKNPLAPATRIGAMAQVCSVNVALGAFYAAAILASGSFVLVS
ncbi:MAG: UbiA family prenyltransferase [Eggerthellaceae bacterium]|nr:UbiA family prenyltransferase [Eggerthellaceae bacterium]